MSDEIEVDWKNMMNYEIWMEMQMKKVRKKYGKEKEKKVKVETKPKELDNKKEYKHYLRGRYRFDFKCRNKHLPLYTDMYYFGSPDARGCKTQQKYNYRYSEVCYYYCYS